MLTKFFNELLKFVDIEKISWVHSVCKLSIFNLGTSYFFESDFDALVLVMSSKTKKSGVLFLHRSRRRHRRKDDDVSSTTSSSSRGMPSKNNVSTTATKDTTGKPLLRFDLQESSFPPLPGTSVSNFSPSFLQFPMYLFVNVIYSFFSRNLVPQSPRFLKTKWLMLLKVQQSHSLGTPKLHRHRQMEVLRQYLVIILIMQMKKAALRILYIVRLPHLVQGIGIDIFDFDFIIDIHQFISLY